MWFAKLQLWNNFPLFQHSRYQYYLADPNNLLHHLREILELFYRFYTDISYWTNQPDIATFTKLDSWMSFMAYNPCRNVWIISYKSTVIFFRSVINNKFKLMNAVDLNVECPWSHLINWHYLSTNTFTSLDDFHIAWRLSVGATTEMDRVMKKNHSSVLHIETTIKWWNYFPVKCFKREKH